MGVSIALYLLYSFPKLCQEDRGVTRMIISEIKKTKKITKTHDCVYVQRPAIKSKPVSDSYSKSETIYTIKDMHLQVSSR